MRLLRRHHRLRQVPDRRRGADPGGHSRPAVAEDPLFAEYLLLPLVGTRPALTGTAHEPLQGATRRIVRMPADPLGKEDPRVVGDWSQLLEALCVLDPDVRAKQARVLVDPIGDPVVIRR